MQRSLFLPLSWSSWYLFVFQVLIFHPSLRLLHAMVLTIHFNLPFYPLIANGCRIKRGRLQLLQIQSGPPTWAMFVTFLFLIKIKNSFVWLASADPPAGGGSSHAQSPCGWWSRERGRQWYPLIFEHLSIVSSSPGVLSLIKKQHTSKNTAVHSLTFQNSWLLIHSI